MDMVCIHFDGDLPRLCKWDGQSLRLGYVQAAVSTATLKDAIEQLGPRPGFHVRYRVEPEGPASEAVSTQIESAAREAGSKWIRRLSNDIHADPGFAAARQAADQHRLGGVIALEGRKSAYRCAALDHRGVVLTHGFIEEAFPLALGEKLQQVRSEANAIATDDFSSLVCFGSAGILPTAVAIGDRSGFRQVLCPDYSPCLSLVGMLIVDLVIELRSEAPPEPMDERRLRERFARLMDEAAREVTKEGYDIDDTVCERFVERRSTVVRVPFEEYLRKPFEVGGLQLRATIHTPKFSLPSTGMARLISIVK